MSIPLVLTLLFALGCYDIPDAPPFSGPADPDTDVDSDTGTETTESTDPADLDVDSDSDADGDTDADADTPTESDTAEDSEPSGTEDTETATADIMGPSCADGIICYDPQRQCATGTSINLYDPIGTCVDGENGGECYYAPIGVEECESGPCEGGVCIEHPCQGVACYSPELSRCMSGNIRRYFSGFLDTQCVEDNTDIGFHCVYDYREVTCLDGCVEGTDGSLAYCRGDPYEHLVCALKPASYCDDSYQWDFNVGSPLMSEDSGLLNCIYDAKGSTPCNAPCVNGRCLESD